VRAFDVSEGVAARLARMVQSRVQAPRGTGTRSCPGRGGRVGQRSAWLIASASSCSVTSRAPVRARTVAHAGADLADSRRLTVPNVVPARLASSSCVRPRSSRSRRIARPSAGSGGRRGGTGREPCRDRRSGPCAWRYARKRLCCSTYTKCPRAGSTAGGVADTKGPWRRARG
jgi:hypothetical protein